MIPQEEIDILMGMEEKEAKMANRYDPVGRTEGMTNSVCDNLRNAYERGYKDGRADAQATDAQIIKLCQKIENEAYERGYKDGQRDTESDNALSNGYALAQREKGRDEGRRKAWEAMEKIVLGECDGGIAFDTLQKIFGFGYMSDICRRYTVDEVIEKLAAYEKKKDNEIKVGDEVEIKSVYDGFSPRKYVVVRIDKGAQTFEGINPQCGADFNLKLENYKCTGRHFDQIAEVLEQMQKGQGEK